MTELRFHRLHIPTGKKTEEFFEPIHFRSYFGLHEVVIAHSTIEGRVHDTPGTREAALRLVEAWNKQHPHIWHYGVLP